MWAPPSPPSPAAGSGVRQRRIDLLAGLLRRATPVEAEYLAKIVIGEMRHGVQEGIVLDAIAALGGIAPQAVRRAQRRSATRPVGGVGEGRSRATRRSGVRLFQPIKPMLAQTAADVASAFAALSGRLALEWKLDGARVQIHKQAPRCASSPAACRTSRAVCPTSSSWCAARPPRDGGVRRRGDRGRGSRPLPFRSSCGAFAGCVTSQHRPGGAGRALSVRSAYLGERPLLDLPAIERWHALDVRAVDSPRPAHGRPASVRGRRVLQAALAAGHEGVMAKALDSPYTPGVRGAAWLKIKRSVTLDLVVIAADWGYGRRHGWLSNYHLAARDPATGASRASGQDVQGADRREFKAMTERLLALRTGEEHGTVFVRPEIVVEVRSTASRRAAISIRHGAALRPHRPHPRRQAPRRSRHRRHAASTDAGRRSLTLRPRAAPDRQVSVVLVLAFSRQRSAFSLGSDRRLRRADS